MSANNIASMTDDTVERDCNRAFGEGTRRRAVEQPSVAVERTMRWLLRAAVADRSDWQESLDGRVFVDINFVADCKSRLAEEERAEDVLSAVLAEQR